MKSVIDFFRRSVGDLPDKTALIFENRELSYKELGGLVDSISTLTMFCKSLETRVNTMNNEMIKIDLLVSSALELTPPIERVARASNFVEDGKIDARRD